MATPKKSEKLRKLVPLKVPYEELRPFRRELSELPLEFLLWNWNCVSASICKEIVDKNKTEGGDLRGNPMLWTIEHWTRVMGRCASSDGDLVFEKSSVGLTRTEEFSYGPLFNFGRQAESNEGTEDDTRRPSIPPQTTVRVPVQVDVMTRRERPERRLAKRRKVVSDDEGDLALEVRRAETEVEVNRQSRTRARPKKRAN
ncbi:hypothetical protein AXG93_2035s1800 [Marchantia polymorpha subsp. ruderalis]|uniref:Uncharacterized protein n=1 Tax=Marchantia polymorpha subsp. ruderalis TaxID=1480154 RepID=A0A176VSI5_MARPO|nr:hypothetical protein AXG93_2035s1800 [Marchantia polymorpha subsp. ruderalis]